MRKIIVPILAACVMFASCADNLKYTDKNGEEKVAKTYGWADYQENHADGIVYRVNIPNVVLSVLFCETAIVPFWLTGWEMFEPVGVEGECESEDKSFLP